MCLSFDWLVHAIMYIYTCKITAMQLYGNGISVYTVAIDQLISNELPQTDPGGVDGVASHPP